MNQSRGSVLAEAAAVANTSATRRKGLLSRDSLARGEGLWIVPCEGIHTFGMKFAIDVVFLDKARRVIKVVHSMPRNRIAVHLLAHSVLELPSGTLQETATSRGDQLELIEIETAP